MAETRRAGAKGFDAVPAAAVDDAFLDGEALLVLLVLVHHRNRQDGRCNPSAATIAEKARLSRRRVFAALKLLEQRGYILRGAVMIPGSRERAPNTYSIAGCSAPGAPRSAHGARGSAPDRVKVVHQVRGNQIQETNDNLEPRATADDILALRVPEEVKKAGANGHGRVAAAGARHAS